MVKLVLLNDALNEWELNMDYVYGLTRSHKHFSDNDNFFLGATPSMCVKVSAAKESLVLDKLEEGYNVLSLQEETTPNVYAEQYRLALDSVDDKDLYFAELSFVDDMVKFNIKYDGSDIINQNIGGATLVQLVKDMCDKAGVEWSVDTLTDMQSILGGYENMAVTWYDGSITARNYISYIAELGGAYAAMDSKRHLRFYRYGAATPQKTISLEVCSSFTLGEEKIVGKKLTYTTGAIVEYVGDENAEEKDTLEINSNNVFITNGRILIGYDESEAIYSDFTITDQLEHIRSVFVNSESGQPDEYLLRIWSVNVEKLIIPEFARAGELVLFDDAESDGNTYQAIWEIEQKYNGHWNGGLSSTFATGKQTATSSKEVPSNVRSIYFNIDRGLNELSVTVDENKVDANNNFSSLNSSIVANSQAITTTVENLKQLTDNVYGNGVLIYDGEIQYADITEHGVDKTITTEQLVEGDTCYIQCGSYISQVVGDTSESDAPYTFEYADFVYPDATATFIYEEATKTFTIVSSNPDFDYTKYVGNVLKIYKGRVGSVQQLSSQIQQNYNNVLITINSSVSQALNSDDTITSIKKWFEFNEEGFVISSDASLFAGVYTERGVEYRNNGTKVMWLDASSSSLGASQLLIGDATSAVGSDSRRWRIYSTDDGQHLRFTRHN